MLLHNPSFPNITREVAKADVNTWLAAGWRKEPPATPDPDADPTPAPDTIEQDAPSVPVNSELPAETQE